MKYGTLILVILSMSSLLCTSQNYSAYGYCREGKKMLDKGKFTKAIELLKNTVELNSHSSKLQGFSRSI